MDMNNFDAVAAEVVSKADTSTFAIQALNDVQLALVGGGCGEVVFG